jgi:hypothetical protein
VNQGLWAVQPDAVGGSVNERGGARLRFDSPAAGAYVKLTARLESGEVIWSGIWLP